MKQHRLCCILLSALMCFFLCACKINGSDSGVEKTTTKTEKNCIVDNGKTAYKGEKTIPENAFVGHLSDGVDQLPVENLVKQEDKYIFRDVVYTCYSENLKCNHISQTDCHWVVNLSCFRPIAQAEGKQHIFAMSDDSELKLLLVCDTDENAGIMCLVRSDSHILDVSKYQIEDFNAKIDGTDVSESSECYALLFEYHTNEMYSTPRVMYLDGDDSQYAHCLILTSKEYPGLSYMVRYVVENFDGYTLNIYNLPNEMDVQISVVDQLYILQCM